MAVNRAEFLQALQAVQAGLSTKATIQQSSCVVFRNNEIITFNEEVACRIKSPLKLEITGAVAAKPLMKILGKLSEEVVDVSVEDNKLFIKGDKREACIVMEADIVLPVDSVEKPGEKWKPLHEDFLDAINTVCECTGRDSEKIALTCVHITKDFVEACDNSQMARYTVPTRIKIDGLVRGEYIKHIVTLEMKEVNETEMWIHFRNDLGLVLSCRRYTEGYPNLTPTIETEGIPTSFPPGLVEAVERAEVFSEENADNNRVRIDLRTGKVRIKGTGNSGWYTETKDIEYDGPYLAFQVSPKLMVQLVKRHNKCDVTGKQLRVNGGKYIYVAALVAAPTNVSATPPKKKGRTDE